MERNEQKENKNTGNGKVNELKKFESNDHDVVIEEFRTEAAKVIDKNRSEKELKIQQLHAENERSMRETEQRYKAKTEFWHDITDAVKTTVVTVGTVAAVGIVSSATTKFKIEELKVEDDEY